MMMFLFLFALAFAPGIFWMGYFYNRDKYDPEPKRHIVRLFIYGILISVPIGLIESVFNPAGMFMMVVVVAPIVEEFVKFYTVKKTAYEYRAFDEPLDGIIYAAAVALGFASIENLMYIGKFYLQGSDLLPRVVVVRAVLTVPGHAVFASMWGYALGKGVVMNDEEAHRKLIWKGVLLSMGFHALFNFLLQFQLLGAIVVIGVAVVIVRWLDRRIDHALEISPHAPKNDTDVPTAEEVSPSEGDSSSQT